MFKNKMRMTLEIGGTGEKRAGHTELSSVRAPEWAQGRRPRATGSGRLSRDAHRFCVGSSQNHHVEGDAGG